ncbi:4Fe-4S dicluster domain-containing protein [Nocardia elegans]|uniref:4Fe-4S dicluster domain-containing protein n=1 Tax=Nocardia elegans TaxID=300029 RepID=A0ABW6TB28_9NOCA|nr:4Fe-4S dicluster domain-containing protein [Nocardia elegans]MBF6244529.1 4Fe-4S dicluster domain-containing protein [Nocardia elegans]MBF6447817.1 4Fe-4S dicluster domain-containing protein [Nocardia elegans]
MTIGDNVTIDRAGLDRLVTVLVEHGYRVIGPQVRDGAIVLDELDSGARLPGGWGVHTEPGRYRLFRRDDEAVFSHSAGPGSWKQFLQPPHRRIARFDADLNSEPVQDIPTPTAFLGVRGCDMAAIGVLGQVLGGGAHPDSAFAARRRELFIIGVNCTEPGGVCFCASMHTGPDVSSGYDLALTERIDDAGHRFLVDVGTEAGARIAAELVGEPSSEAEISAARAEVAAAADRMGRSMPDVDIRDVLSRSRESSHWQDVASRCLTCANCTMVCPTCFCTTTEDVTDLTGTHAERWERWASCFELDFSHLHGGSVRQSGESRYRQWLTHKLSTWYDQFGSSGCVGCGRCIAWCPAGIDLTVEVARLAETVEGGDDDHR